MPLAARFGVTLENYSVRNQPDTQDPSNVIAIQNAIPYLAYQAPTMTAHDACIISPNTGVSVQEIAVFPSTWQAYSSTTNKITPPPTPYFCAVVPYNATGAGSLLGSKTRDRWGIMARHVPRADLRRKPAISNSC